eukprot:g13664.t1
MAVSTAASLLSAVESGCATIIDLRDEDEKHEGACFGAISVPWSTWTKVDDSEGADNKLRRPPSSLLSLAADKNRPIIAHCRGGGRGGKAKLSLEAAGYTNVLNGGGPQKPEIWCAWTAAASDYEYFVPPSKVAFFQQNGYVVLENVISPNEVKRYVDLLQQMLDGEISTKDKRGDLGGHVERVDQTKENTVQIMHPQILTSKLDGCEHFRKGEDIANQLYYKGIGQRENWGLDCSQFLVKFPKTMTETPWHQDQSYYPPGLVGMDARACNIWLALEDCTVDSGCLHFIPTPLSCNALSPHRAAGNGRGALMTDPPSEGLERRTTTPMRAGSVVAFNNYTYHYGGPNITEKRRPAFVAQFRPKKMIQACRVLFGFDHGKFTSNEDGALRTVNAAASKKEGEGGGAD